MSVDPRTLRSSIGSLVGRRRALAGAIGLLALALLSGLAVLLADGSWALPTAFRQAALPLALVAALGLLFWAWRLLRRAWPDDAEAARLASIACDDHQRHLLVALDLGARADELAQAGAAAARQRIPPVDRQRLPPSGIGRRLAGLAAVLVLLAVVAVVAPGFYGSVLPRFLDPTGDHPPFSFTQLRWGAVPERVRIGDPVRCEVLVDGAREGLVLWALDAAGERLQVPMYRIGEGRFAAEIARVAGPLRLWVAGGGTRTRFRQLDIDPMPVLHGLGLAMTAPAYADLPVEQEHRQAGELGRTYELLAGSRLRLTPESNRPLAALRCRRGEADWQRLPLADGVADWSDPPPGTWMLQLESADGVLGPELPLATIQRREDLPPRSRIEQPERDALAIVGMRLPLRCTADDDLGLAQVQRRRAYNGLPAPDLQHRCDGREWQWDGSLDLATLGVVPGDVLQLAVWARDRLPGGGQVSEAAERRIRIISMEDYREQLRQRRTLAYLRRKYDDLLRELDELEAALAELIHERRSGQADADDIDRRLQALAKRARDLARRGRTGAQREHLLAMETELHRSLAEQAEALAQAIDDGSLRESLLGMHDLLAGDLDRLRQLAKGHALMARLRQLIDAQQNATRQLAALPVHRRLSDDERVQLRQLGATENDLARAIEEWLDLAPDMIEQLRRQADSPTAAEQLAELARRLAELDAADGLRRAAVEARRGEALAARDHATAVRDALLALLPPTQQCQQGLEAALMGMGLCGLEDLLASLRDLSRLAGNGFGWGIGGAGMGGAGFWLGYGGDDPLGTAGGLAMDLYGPEGIDQGRQEAGGIGRSDGVAAAAAASADRPLAATGYARGLRRTTASERVHLDRSQRSLVADYYRFLEEDHR